MIAVIIPVRNGARLIGAQLDALAGQAFNGDWELIVVDNGSTDNTEDIVARWCHRLPVRLLHLERAGANTARNAGASTAIASRLAFLDHDDVAAPGWLDAMNRALDEHPLVGGRLDYERLNTPLAVAAHAQKLAVSNLPLYRGAPHAMGCNMGCQRAAFDEIGGFDPAMSRGADEIDFFFRAHQLGIEASFAPDATVAYRLRTSSRECRTQMHNYAVGDAQLAAKLRLAGAIPKQSNRSRLAATWGHVKGLAGMNLWFTPVGRRQYSQRMGYTVGAVVGFVRFRQIVL
jgi:glycosyltransferase involved in cell wall biosynthesis